MSQPDLIVVVKDDPFSDRAPRLLTAKAGTPIADLVDMAGFEQIEIDHTEASINGEVVDAELWAETPAKDHVQLVVLPQGGGDGNKVLRTVLSLAVVVAAFYLGGPIAGALGLTFQGAGAAVAAVLTTIGQLALNAILPPPSFETGAAPDPVYFIEGQRNQLRLFQPLATVLGRHRVVPFLGARPYPEIRGDDTYYYLLVELGPIGVEVTDRKVADTPISNFDEVVYQSRLVASDPHPTMASRQTISESVGATLLSNDPELRRTASDVIDVDIILSFPQGLGEVDSRGNPKSHSLSIQIRYREVINPGPSETFGPWRFASEPVNPLYPPFRNISSVYGFTGLTDGGIDGLNYYGTRGNFSFTEAKPAQPFFRQIGFSLPSEGTYEVEIERVSADSSDAGTFDDVTWQTLLSKRDDQQVMRDDVAYEVYRFKGTDETSGVIDELNMVVGRLIPTFPDAILDQSDLSGVTAADLSETRVSSNAWEIILWTMRNGFQGRLPTTDDGFDWPSWAAAAKDARDRGLKFDYVVQQDVNVDDLGNLIASFGGEGRVYSYNNIWTAGLDRPVPAPSHVFRDGTARNISSSKTFPEEVHAYRVQFNDAGNEYRTREETIYVDGHTDQTASRFEDLPVTGKTDWDDLHRYVAQVYRNSRLQTKALTLEVPKSSVDNSMRLMSRVSVASRVISKTIQTGVIRSVSESGGTVTSIELDQEVELGPNFPGFGIKWVTLDGSGNPTISAVSVIADPAFDGMYSTIDLVTPVSVSGGPAAGLEYIVGPVTEAMYDGLLADIEDAGEDWVRLDLRAYAPARFDESGLSIPAYAIAPVLPYGSRPPAPILESIRASNLNVVVNISLPDGYDQPIREIRVWRALATPATDPNPGLLTEFEQQPSLAPETRKFINPPGEVGQNFVYRFQAVAVSGRVGFILNTAPVEVTDALPAIQSFVAADGLEIGAGGESKPTLIFGWTPDDDRRISGIVLQVRQVAKDGGGARLPEGSQPAYETAAFLSASEGLYVLRGLAGGQDYDAAAYFVGRRGELGTLKTFQDVSLAVSGTGPASSVPWSGVVDDGGKPDDDADRTILNIAAGISGQGWGATASEGQVSNEAGMFQFPSMLPNAQFLGLDGDGLPLGIEPVEGQSGRTYIEQISASTGGLRITGPGDGTVSYGFPAMPIDDKATYTIRIRHRTPQGSNPNGLYLRMNEKDAPLADGMTHLGIGTGGAKTDGRTGFVDFTADGPTPGSAFEEVEYTYTPTPGTKFASFSMYRWSGFGGDDYEVAWVSVTQNGDYDRGADPTDQNISAGFAGQDWGATASENDASNALTQLPPGMAIGGLGSVSFTANLTGDGSSNDGEIGLTPGRIYTAGGGLFDTASGRTVTTAYEGGGATGLFYLMHSLTAITTRFPTFNGNVAGGNVATVFYDWSARQWYAKDNAGVNFAFSPVDGDTLVAVGYRESASSQGIDWVRSFLGVWVGLPEDNADQTAANTALAIINQGWGATASEESAGNNYVGVGFNTLKDTLFRNSIDFNNNWSEARNGGSQVTSRVDNGQGLRYLKTTVSGVSSGNWFGIAAGVQNYVPVQPGATVGLAAYVGAVGCNDIRLTAICYDENGGYVTEVTQTFSVPGDGEPDFSDFGKISGAFTVPSNASIKVVRFRCFAFVSSGPTASLSLFMPTLALLPDGQTVGPEPGQGADIAEGGADETGGNISAGFTGQGPLSTSNIGEVDLGQAFNRGDNLVQNAYFADPRYGGSGIPNDWSNWSNGGNLSRGFYQGRPTMLGDASSLTGLGLLQNVPITPGVTYKQRLVMARTGGTYLGAGMHISVRNSGGTAVQSQNINAATLAPAGSSVSTTHDGVTVWERIWTAPATASYCLLYPMWAWTGFGAAGGGSGFQGHILEASLTPLDETERRTQTQEDNADETSSHVALGFDGQGNLSIANMSIGNTAARPANPAINWLHINTQTNEFEYYNGSSWGVASNTTADAGLTGGSANKAEVTGTGSSGTVTTDSVTVTPSGGSGHAFSWALFGPDASQITITDDDAATTTFSASVSTGDAFRVTAICTITAGGKSVQVICGVNILQGGL